MFHSNSTSILSMLLALVMFLGPLLAASIFAKRRGLNFRSQLGAVSLNYILPATAAVAPAAGTVKSMMIVDVTATADADTTATIPHLMTTTPLVVVLTPTLSQALTALSAWVVSSITSSNVVLTKLASTGSGSGSAQLRVTIMRPNTIIT